MLSSSSEHLATSIEYKVILHIYDYNTRGAFVKIWNIYMVLFLRSFGRVKLTRHTLHNHLFLYLFSIFLQ